MKTYHLDPRRIPLDRVKDQILGRKLSEKRRILADDAESRFARMRQFGILTLGDLIDATKTKTALARFQSESGFPEDYLVVLRREALGYLPQPVDLKRIPGVDSGALTALSKARLADSKKLWERVVLGAIPMEALASEVGKDAEILRELLEMSDLARIPGVGPVFAKMIHEAGYLTTRELAAADVEELERRLKEVNAGGRYTKVTATTADLAACIGWARELSSGA